MTKAPLEVNEKLVLDSACQVAVRVAAPLLRRFDNPFFGLEIRLLARCESVSGRIGVEWWAAIPLILMGLTVCLALLIRIFNAPSVLDNSFEIFAGFVATFHFVLCLGVTVWGAGRIFQREHLSGTINDMLLLPYESLRWVAMKIVFPLHLLALAWLAGLPFHALLIATGGVALSVVAKALLLPLWAGLTILAYTLLWTPDYLSDPPRPGPQTNEARPPGQKRAIAQSADEVARCALSFLFIYVSFFGWMRWVFNGSGFDVLFEVRRFFDFFAPAGLFWITLNVGFFTAAMARAGAMLSPSHEMRQRASALLWCALTSIYYTGLGFFWSGLKPVVAWGALIGAPLLAIVFSVLAAQYGEARRRPENDEVSQADDAAKTKRRLNFRPQLLSAEHEIAWLAKQFDNAVFVKDLRVHLRQTSLLSGLLWSGIWAAFWLWILTKWPIGASQMWWFYLRPFEAPGEKAGIAWQQEARGATLPLLLMAPMSSRDILRGRCWAALIAGFPTLLFSATVIGVLLHQFVSRGHQAFWPALLSVLPAILIVLFANATAVPADLFSEDKKQGENNSGGAGCLGLLLASPCLGLFFLGNKLSPAVNWILDVLLCFIYLCIAVGIYDGGIERLDKRRRMHKHRSYRK